MEVSKTVVLDDTKSDTVLVVSEVPQGYVLVNLSCIHYTSDLFESIENKVLLYADDLILAALILSPIDCPRVLASLNRDLALISDQCQNWSVRFNPAKSVALVVIRSRTDQPSYVWVGCSVVLEYLFVDILLVRFDRKVTFDLYVGALVLSLSRQLGI